MYTGAKTVRTDCSEVKVGKQQASALSQLLFLIVLESLSTEFRVALPWELLYTNDFVVIAESEEDLIKRPNEWKDTRSPAER